MFLFQHIAHQYTLSELFDIRQGLLLPSKSKREKALNGVNKYKSLFISDMPAAYEPLDVESLADCALTKEIKKTHLLCKQDYLISAKGQIKGYALYHSKAFEDEDSQKYLGIIASNHFIVFRPRTSTLEAFGESYFIYNILDLIIPRLNILTKQSTKKNQTPYRTISDLQNFTIDLPNANTLYELNLAFLELQNDFELKIKELNESRFRLNHYNKSLLTQFFK
jgi:hypothetical protein